MAFGDMSQASGLDYLREWRPRFDASHLSEPTHKYVAWVDLMGAKATMLRSMPITANFIGKLHCAALLSLHQTRDQSPVRFYPMVDGLYMTATDEDSMELLSVLKTLFITIAAIFLFEDEAIHHFLVRGGLAYGPLWEGDRLVSHCDEPLSADWAYCDSILLGPPVTEAYEAERQAAPFGMWVSQSALSFGQLNSRMTFAHWRWWLHDTELTDWAVPPTLASQLAEYFRWCRLNTRGLLYPMADIEKHEALAREYFGPEYWPKV